MGEGGGSQSWGLTGVRYKMGREYYLYGGLGDGGLGQGG